MVFDHTLLWYLLLVFSHQNPYNIMYDITIDRKPWLFPHVSITKGPFSYNTMNKRVPLVSMVSVVSMVFLVSVVSMVF